MDKISIKNLELYGYHGVFEEEKNLGQKFYISCELKLDFKPCIYNEDLNKSVHYGEVCETIKKAFESKKFDLIETLSYHINQTILDAYPLVKEVQITVDKPQAPVKLTFESISVTSNMKRNRVYVSIGSNIGDLKHNFITAIDKIISIKNTKILNESKRIQTKPFGNVDQDDFLNSILILETTLEAYELLHELQKIEVYMGRTREIHWGPRIIDLDILFFNQDIINTENLQVPHPYIQARKFILDSLLELNPNLIHPLNNKRVFEMIEALDE